MFKPCNEQSYLFSRAIFKFYTLLIVMFPIKYDFNKKRKKIINEEIIVYSFEFRFVRLIFKL